MNSRRVLVTPRDPNPYQGLLYDALEVEGWDVRYCDGPTRSQSVNVLAKPFMLAWHRACGFRLLHVHWVYDFCLPWVPRHRGARRVLQIWFRVYLIAARLLGIRVVWTAHNLVPHQPVFDDDRNARRVLVEQSRAVIALSEASVAELASIGARDVRVIPFGAYAQRQDDTLATTGARPRLELGNGDFVAVFIGRIEPYKGVLNLIAAAQRIDVARPVRVLIGGECRDAAHRADLCAAIGNDTRCRLRLEWLSDSEVGAYLQAADVAVFPFARVTNSSSIVLALCHGVPVVAPRLRSLIGIPPDCGVWYDPDDDGGLERALVRAANLTHAESLAMREAALAYGASLDWAAVGTATADLYEEVLSR